ncbi:putative E3 ubiquitin-protein ligase RNF217-like protein [Dinothrombium tinctorium]|uniref:Putative E3 ubiquitin-protein ligase RNF217-like protein n=1 Tax=Dinothrombium tinctorium TaxID=1965070 RepID=A0A443QUS3_9ACAR|nr:putative E3 ubiquitin-protein ligase RNF217-like protein [Dinothrombium tinctorium]
MSDDGQQQLQQEHHQHRCSQCPSLEANERSDDRRMLSIQNKIALNSTLESKSAQNDLWDITPELEAIIEDELIIEELLEMRLLLNNLAFSPTSNSHSLYNMLVLRPQEPKSNSSENLSTEAIKEPIPHFPVGSWDYEECKVCCETVWLYRRPCCDYPACNDCLTNYFENKVKLGIVSIECVNPQCHEYVHRDEISVRLAPEVKKTYCRLLAFNNCDEIAKTCPRCNHIRRLQSESELKQMKKKTKHNFNLSR